MGIFSGLPIFQRKLFFQTGILFAIIAVLGGGMFFMGKSISTNAGEIERLRFEKANWASSVQSYVSAKTQYVSKGREYERILENILPQRDQLIDLKRDFQFLASGEGLDLIFSFSGEREKGSPLVGAVGVTLTVQGKSEDEVMSFFDALGDFRYLFSIDSVSLQNERERGESPQRASATIKGEVLYRNSGS